MTAEDKAAIKQEIVRRLSGEPEVQKVVIFGSFPWSPDPHDLDVAVFQDSDQKYLPLAMKYRRLLRPVADRIALDVLPLRAFFPEGGGWFVRDEVMRGEVVYER